MGLRVNLPEPGDAVVRVDLCGLQRGVPEEFLYFTHIGAAVQKVGGECVPQHMGALLALYARAVQFFLHRSVHRRPGYAFSFVC